VAELRWPKFLRSHNSEGDKRFCARQAYHVLPYFGAKLVAELPVGAIFPLLFGTVVYPLTGLNPRPSR